MFFTCKDFVFSNFTRKKNLHQEMGLCGELVCPPAPPPPPLPLGSAEACNFIKRENPAQVILCEFYEIFKNTFFTEQVWTTASTFLTYQIPNCYWRFEK